MTRFFWEFTLKLFDQEMKVSLLGGDVSYNPFRKHAFHRAGKRLLKRIADELGLVKEQYDLRSNLGGIAVSGEVTLHTDTLYLQLSQGILWHGEARILYRRCNGRKDYCGHANHFMAVEQLLNEKAVERFIAILRTMGKLQSMPVPDYRMAA